MGTVTRDVFTTAAVQAKTVVSAALLLVLCEPSARASGGQVHRHSTLVRYRRCRLCRSRGTGDRRGERRAYGSRLWRSSSAWAQIGLLGQEDAMADVEALTKVDGLLVAEILIVMVY